MKRCPLLMPNKMAEYLQYKKLPADLQVRSFLLMLYPFMEDKILTQKQVAELVGMPEADVRFIYDHYELPEGADASWNHAKEEEGLLREFDEAKKVRSVG